MRTLRGIPALGVLIAACAIGAVASPAPRLLRDADRYTQFGSQALKAGNFGKARDLFDRALRAVPSYPDAHLGLGHIAMGERQFETALIEFELARDAYADVADSLFELQLLHYSEAQEQVGRLRGEIMVYQKLIAGRSSGQASLIERKITLIEESIQRLETIKAPSTARVASPPGEIYFYIGNALFNLDRLAEAVDAWERCARESPRFPLVYNNLAVAYWKKGRIDQALESLSRAEGLGLPVNPSFRADLEKSATQRLADTTLQR